MSKDNRKLRVIDKGTSYDVPAKLKKIAREIERGELGDIETAVLVLRERTPAGNAFTRQSYFGKGSFAEAVLMIEVAKSRWLK